MVGGLDPSSSHGRCGTSAWREFALRGGADPTSAMLWPLSVDGLLVLATVGLLKSGQHSSWLRSFVRGGSDYPSHAAQEAAIARYLRWRNKHAQPKRRFAIGPKIRQPDYLPLSA